MNALFIKDNVCAKDANSFFGKFGWFFAWLGDGTDCRCCMGIRIFTAFFVGGAIGYLLRYNITLGIVALVVTAFLVGLFFFIWLMIQAEAQREQELEDSDLIDYGNEPLSSADLRNIYEVIESARDRDLSLEEMSQIQNMYYDETRIDGIYYGAEPINSACTSVEVDEPDIEDSIFDTDKDHLDYIQQELEARAGHKLSDKELEIIHNQWHAFKYAGVSGLKRDPETGAPVIDQWLDILHKHHGDSSTPDGDQDPTNEQTGTEVADDAKMVCKGSVEATNYHKHWSEYKSAQREENRTLYDWEVVSQLVEMVEDKIDGKVSDTYRQMIADKYKEANPETRAEQNKFIAKYFDLAMRDKSADTVDGLADTHRLKVLHNIGMHFCINQHSAEYFDTIVDAIEATSNAEEAISMLELDKEFMAKVKEDNSKPPKKRWG